MNKTCELLLESFYNDEWKLINCGANIWTRSKDGLELWGDNTVFDFTGHNNNIHIPWYLRPYMRSQLRKGQNAIATRKYLESNRIAELWKEYGDEQ